MSQADFLIIKCAAEKWQGHLSGTASAHVETTGHRQPGERRWQECPLSKTRCVSEYGTPSSQPTQELDDEEPLLELPLLRLGTERAAIKVGGDVVKSAASAAGMLPKSTRCKGILQQCKRSQLKTKLHCSTRNAK